MTTIQTVHYQFILEPWVPWVVFLISPITTSDPLLCFLPSIGWMPTCVWQQTWSKGWLRWSVPRRRWPTSSCGTKPQPLTRRHSMSGSSKNIQRRTGTTSHSQQWTNIVFLSNLSICIQHFSDTRINMFYLLAQSQKFQTQKKWVRDSNRCPGCKVVIWSELTSSLWVRYFKWLVSLEIDIFRHQFCWSLFVMIMTLFSLKSVMWRKCPKFRSIVVKPLTPYLLNYL